MKCVGGLDCKDDSQHPVEGSRVGDGVDVRAYKHGGTRCRRGCPQIARCIEPDGEAGLLHPLPQMRVHLSHRGAEIEACGAAWCFGALGKCETT